MIRRLAEEFGLYISRGDYNLPFGLIYYLQKHTLVWLFQTGAVNFDGVMRIPARLTVMAIFSLFGSLAASYYYLGLSYTLIAISFFLFMRFFLDIKSWKILLPLTIFYTLNAVFLGNTAKIGLVAAAGLLPLCLVFVRYFFKTEKFLYLFLLILAFNYTLIHPYHVAVNAVVVLLYSGFLFYQHKSRIKHFIKPALLALVVGIGLHLYFLLPLISVGTLDKSAVMQQIGNSAPPDYSSIIEISNAGDSVSALTLSKNVFLDFYFYNSPITQILFITGIILFYIVLICLFIVKNKNYSNRDRNVVLVLMAILLLGVLLSSGADIISDALISIVNLPGGWIFRSPLKWQLYAPFALFGAIAIQLKYLKHKEAMITIGILWVGFICSCSFILYSVFSLLLVPKQPSTFTELPRVVASNERVLFIVSGSCNVYLQENPNIFNELNQFFTSMPIQVKRVTQSDAVNIKLTSYDYVLTCASLESDEFVKQNDFKIINTFADNNFRLFSSSVRKPLFSTVNDLYISDVDGHDNKRDNYVRNILNEDYTFVPSSNNFTNQRIDGVFDDISPEDFSSDGISVKSDFWQKKLTASKELYATTNEDYQVALSTTKPSSMNPIIVGEDKQVLNSAFPKVSSVIYKNSNFTFKPITLEDHESTLKDNSLQDCYNYDNKPSISKDLVGEKDLKLNLSASSHIACVSSDKISLQNKESIFISFEYLTEDANSMGFSIVFDDAASTTLTYRIPVTSYHEWTQYNNIVSTPLGANNVRIIFNGYPDSTISRKVTVSYDKTKLIEVPNDINNLFAIGGEKVSINDADIDYEEIDPTRYQLNVSNAKDNIFILMNNTYHKGWRLSDGTIFGKEYGVHTVSNGYDNGWYVDVNQLCSRIECKLKDGVYEFDIVADFYPQRMFVFGGILSAVTFIVVVAGLAYSRYSNR